MMTYSEKDGVFPFTKEELLDLSNLLDKKILELEENLNSVDVHRYIRYKQTLAKIDGFKELMDSKDKEKRIKASVIKYEACNSCSYINSNRCLICKTDDKDYPSEYEIRETTC